MVTDNHYRWDFIGLSTDVKPTPQTSKKVVDGSTFYCSDTSKLYVFCNNTWYERKPLGGGGGGTTYTAGEGITIDDDTISADLEVLQTKVVTVLTDDDANYTDNDSNEYVALWLLPNGKYTMAEDMNVPILPSLNADGEPIDTRSADTQPLVLIYNLGEGDYADISVLDSNGGWNHYVVEYDTGIFDSNNTAFPTVFNGTDGTANGTEGLVPAPTTSDAGKFLKADGTWATAGGGGGDTVYSTVTTSNRTAGGAVYIGNLDASQVEQPDPTTTDLHEKYFWALPNINTSIPANKSVNIMGTNASEFSVAIGEEANVPSLGSYGTAIGYGSSVRSQHGVALGESAYLDRNMPYSVALGAHALPTRAGEVNVGTGNQALGYNSTNYRVIGGVHDGQNNHDVATVAQGNTLSTSAPTTSTEGVLGQLWTDTTNMHTYQCTAIDTTDPNNPSYTWTQRW